MSETLYVEIDGLMFRHEVLHKKGMYRMIWYMPFSIFKIIISRTYTSTNLSWMYIISIYYAIFSN